MDEAESARITDLAQRGNIRGVAAEYGAASANDRQFVEDQLISAIMVCASYGRVNDIVRLLDGSGWNERIMHQVEQSLIIGIAECAKNGRDLSLDLLLRHPNLSQTTRAIADGVLTNLRANGKLLQSARQTVGQTAQPGNKMPNGR